MIRNEEAIWCRLELQCLLTLMKLSQPGVSLQPRTDNTGDHEPMSASGLSNNFGGTVSSPANALAVDAIGNAFAKVSMPTTAGAIPVYSSADFI